MIRTLENYPGYGVDEDGNVWSRKSGFWKRMKPTPDPIGRPCVTLGMGPRRVLRHVCGLVLAAFVGPRPRGQECLHFDGNPANNKLSNLRWGTRAENEADKKRHGTDNAGERNGNAKLTELRVAEIRELAGTMSNRKLGAIFGVSETTVRKIVLGKHWKGTANA